MSECGLIPGGFGILVQFLLGCLCIAVLIYKKHLETSKGVSRSWREFLLDSSKQLLGAGMIHILNLLFAAWFGGMSGVDACNWYWVNIVIDCTLGVGVEYVLLRVYIAYLLPLCFAGGDLEDFQTGDYGDPYSPNVKRYVKQLCLWCSVVASMKIIMVILMAAFAFVFAPLSAWILSPLEDAPKAKLVVVMIVTPGGMNALQLWITDNFLRKNEGAARDALATAPRIKMQDMNDSPVGLEVGGFE